MSTHVACCMHVTVLVSRKDGVLYTLMVLTVRKKAEGRAIGRANGGQLPSFMSTYVWLLVLGFLRHETFML
jgi:membrane protein CcdC involved in cytochrome C biogenesis